jgi:hypothetical protein
VTAGVSLSGAVDRRGGATMIGSGGGAERRGPEVGLGGGGMVEPRGTGGIELAVRVLETSVGVGVRSDAGEPAAGGGTELDRGSGAILSFVIETGTAGIDSRGGGGALEALADGTDPLGIAMGCGWAARSLDVVREALVLLCMFPPCVFLRESKNRAPLDRAPRGGLGR